jgi:hypothetical protein
MGFDFLAFEVDPDYWRAAADRLERERAQIRLWDIDPNQEKLF